jgi:hypothetical protein
MDTHRIGRALALAALAAGVAVACAPERAPLAPAARAARTELVAAPTVDGATKLVSWRAPALRRANALREDVTVGATIGPRGGRLAIPEAGFALDIPAGAVAAPTAFTVTALAGDLLAYEFGPSGSNFPVALRATQDLRDTQARKLRKGTTLNLGYFQTPADLDVAAGTANVAQEMRGTVDQSGRYLTVGIPHFSGWLILWRDGEEDSTQTP